MTQKIILSLALASVCLLDPAYAVSDNSIPASPEPCLPSEELIEPPTDSQPAKWNITSLKIYGSYLQLTIETLSNPKTSQSITWFSSPSINRFLHTAASEKQDTSWIAKCKDGNNTVYLNISGTMAQEALNASEQATRPRFLLDVLSGPIFALASSRPLMNTFAYPVAANISFEPMFYIPTKLSTLRLLIGLPISFYFDPAVDSFAVSMLPVGIQIEKHISSMIQLVLQTSLSLLQYRQATAEPSYLGQFDVRLGIRSVISSHLSLGLHYRVSSLENLHSGAGILFNGIQASVGYIK